MIQTNLAINNPPSLPIPSKPSPVVAQGRIIRAIGAVTKALIELILKIVNAVFYLFGPYRIKLYSLDEEKAAINDKAVQTVTAPPLVEQAEIAKKETAPYPQFPATFAPPPAQENQPIQTQDINSFTLSKSSVTTPKKNWRVKAPDTPVTPVTQRRIIRFSEEVQISDEEAIEFFEKEKIKQESLNEKMEQIAIWVLNQTSLERTKVQAFLSTFVRKLRDNLFYSETYNDWVGKLNSKQLLHFLELLEFEIPEGMTFDKADPPLFIHIAKEKQLASLTGGSKTALVEARSKVFFSMLTEKHAKVLIHNADFWTLMSQFTKSAAKKLKVEALAIFIQNKSKHLDPFKKLISYLPEDDLLPAKLAVMVPHTTQNIEHALRNKTEKLSNFEYNDVEGTPVTKEKRQKMKNALNSEINTKVKTPLKEQNV